MKQNEVFEPCAMPGFKIVGKIDLDSLPKKTHPEPDTSRKVEQYINRGGRDRELMRQKLDEWFVGNAKEYLGMKKGNVDPYNDGDIVKFTLTDGTTGYAVGRTEPLKQEIGYYIAIGMYGENVITKYGDEGDGEISDGYWPLNIMNIQHASKEKAEILRMFLMPQIERERNVLRELILQEALDLAEEQRRRIEEEKEAERKRKEEERLKAEAEQREREKQEALARIEEQRQQLIAEAESTIESDAPFCKGETVESLAYLDYVRGEKTAELNEWPRMTRQHRFRSFVYEFLSRVNLTFEKITSHRDYCNTPARNHILSREYYKMMKAKRNEYVERYDSFLNAAEAAGYDRFLSGSISWVNGEGVRQTIIYVACTEKPRSWNIMYLEDDDMILHNIFSKRSGEGNDYSQTLIASDTSIYMNNKTVLGRITDILLCFFGMEAETQALTHNENENGNRSSSSSSSSLATDIFFRTAAWYTECTVPATEVASYESHRWKGSGENKTLEPVTVSGYTKGAYTRQAQCEK